jgi:hypothetical protein
MGTKDRTLRDMPSRGSQRTAVRENRIWTVGKDETLIGILTQLKVLQLAATYEPARRGRPVRRDVPIRLVKYLDEYCLSISTNGASPTVNAASAAINLSPGRVVELMHQVTQLAHWLVLPQQVQCVFTFRERIALIKRLRIRLSPAQERHHRNAAARRQVRLGQSRLRPRERQYRAGARRTLVSVGQARGRRVCLTALDIGILLCVSRSPPGAGASALAGARLKLRRARNFLGRFYRRPGYGRLAFDRWAI